MNDTKLGKSVRRSKLIYSIDTMMLQEPEKIYLSRMETPLSSFAMLFMSKVFIVLD